MKYYQALRLLGLFAAMVTTATAGDIGHDQQGMHQSE